MSSNNQVTKLSLPDQQLELPIVLGSEGEKAIDIRKLRSETGYITLDSGYGNTGSCLSGITFIDGEKGILRYRGYPIEELAQKRSFLEVAYLLIYGELPDAKTRDAFQETVTRHTLIHEDMKKFFEGYPRNAHPMAILASMFCSLSTYYAAGDDHLDQAGTLGIAFPHGRREALRCNAVSA